MPGTCVYQVLRLDYPWRLRELPRPPPSVWIRGSWAGNPAVAIVGTRQPSVEAATYAYDLAQRLAMAGVVVWSGGAVGIDAAAHRGALAARGRTVVVMGTGMNHCFPREHDALYKQILDARGGLVYPFDPSQRAMTWTFLQRNGVLAAMIDALIIVQAPLRSGARSAAAWARRLGRPIFSVPTCPWDERGMGNLDELRLGAHVLSDDILAERLGIDLPRKISTSPPQKCPDEPKRPSVRTIDEVQIGAAEPLSATHMAVLRAIGSTPRHFDDISEATALPPPMLQEALLTLTLQAVLVEGPIGFYRRINH